MEQGTQSSASPALSSPIRQILPILKIAPTVVTRETPVADLPASFGGNRECRTIAVVDASDILVGIIPVAVIMHRLLFQMIPEEFLEHVLEPSAAAELAKEQHARTATEVMHPPLFLGQETTVQDAIHALRRANLEGLPVVDQARHIVGYVDLLEIMLLWWQGNRPADTRR